MSDDIWVLGATGRSGRGIARHLRGTGHSVVLAGRDPARLASIAGELGDAGVVSGSLESLLAQLRSAAPAVVVNTIGPFARTSGRARRLVRFAVAGARRQLTTPAGDTVTTAALPTGDLLAAWRASNADSVIAATSMIPSGLAVRAAFPALSVVMLAATRRRPALHRGGHRRDCPPPGRPPGTTRCLHPGCAVRSITGH